MPITERRTTNKSLTYNRHRRGTALRLLPLSVLSLLLFGTLAILTGCNTGDVAYLQYRDMRGWEKGQILEFDLSGVDTMPGHTAKSKYDMSVNVRIDNDYTYSVLPILVLFESPTGFSHTDTLLIPIQAADKRKQSIGGLSNISYPIKNNTTLPHASRVTIRQISDHETLLGVTAVGVLLKKK